MVGVGKVRAERPRQKARPIFKPEVSRTYFSQRAEKSGAEID
jgi:hypothetical protein